MQYTNTKDKRLKGGGSYSNLFDADLPFKIVGNFTRTLGMAEMMLQSQSGQLPLLPALPSACSGGEITALRARGGFEVSIEWKDIPTALYSSSTTKEHLVIHELKTDKQGQFSYDEHKHYLLLDMQLGGDWIGPIEPNNLPVEREIDWVRFYAFKNQDK